LLRQALNEPRQLDGAVVLSGASWSADRSERVDRDERGFYLAHLGDDASEHRIQVGAGGFLAQVHETDGGPNLCSVEERELLLIAHHLHRRLAEHREVERRVFLRRVREQELLHERGLAGARSAGDEVERELAEAATKHLIEPRHAGGDVPDERMFRGDHGVCPPPVVRGRDASPF